jgi:hypothetical protein
MAPRNVVPIPGQGSRGLGPGPVAQSVGGSDCGSEGIGVRSPLWQKQSEAINISLSKTRLFWWFRVVRSLLPRSLRWLSPSSKSPMVGADVKP